MFQPSSVTVVVADKYRRKGQPLYGVELGAFQKAIIDVFSLPTDGWKWETERDWSLRATRITGNYSPPLKEVKDATY